MNLKKYLISLILFSLILPAPLQAACRDESLLLPEVQVLLLRLRNIASSQGIEFIVTCTYRTQKEQDILYAKGRTSSGRKVTWTKRSAHTEKRAFDVAILVNGNISWKNEDYTELGRIGQELGLIWGGSWRVKDSCHFEIPKKEEK